MRLRTHTTIALLTTIPAAAHAAPFEFVRLGDADSFGFENVPSLTGVGGGASDRDGNGRLNDGDTLPDINDNGVISGVGGDLFDHRSAAELAGSSVSASGTQSTAGTSGSQFTDVAVSTNWTTDPGGQPGFVFDFTVADADVSLGADIFVNFLLADLGQNATVRYTSLDGSETTTTLTALTDPGTEDDGYVQESFITLAFDDVFTATKDGYRGYLEIDIQASGDPYVAFDFAEVSVDPIPAPGTLALASLALLTTRRKR